jgi:hypothetical protein
MKFLIFTIRDIKKDFFLSNIQNIFAKFYLSNSTFKKKGGVSDHKEIRKTYSNFQPPSIVLGTISNSTNFLLSANLMRLRFRKTGTTNLKSPRPVPLPQCTC